MRNPIASITLCLSLLTTGGAHAELSAADGGLTVYDDVANLYWLADVNFSINSGYDADGLMSWYQAQSWIDGLNASNYLGYSDWRLPTSLQPDPACSVQVGGDSYGFNCTGNELGNLFYNGLGVTAGSTILSASNTAGLALFDNVIGDTYWSSTEVATDTDSAWYFDTYNGSLNLLDKDYLSPAWAVRSGPVSAVPEPGKGWLLGIGLLVLMGVARRRLVLR